MIEFILGVILIAFLSTLGLVITIIASLIASIYYATEYNEDSFQAEKKIYLDAQGV